MIGWIVFLIDPKVETDDNPIAFLALLGFPIAFLVPFNGFLLTIGWLLARFAPPTHE